MNSSHVSQRAFVTLVALLAGALAGCSDGNTQPLEDRVIIEERNIQGISLSAARSVIAVNEVLQVSAVESTSGEDLADDLAWSSSDAAVASVDGAGQVTGVADGLVTIRASIGDVEDTLMLTVSSAGLISLEVQNSAGAIDVCTSGQLTASGTYADGRVEDETANVTWLSADAAAADFDATTPGQLNTRVAGTLNVSASLNNVTAPDVPIIITDSLSSVSAVLAAAAIDIGAQTTLAVTGNYSGNLVEITGNATFASSAANIATVDTSGTVSGIAAGSAQISATCNALTSDATVTVNGAASRTLVDLELDGNEPFTVQIGSTRQLTALAEYSDGTTEDVTVDTTWTVAVGSANVFSVSNVPGQIGVVTPLAPGTGFVVADFETESVRAQIDVVP